MAAPPTGASTKDTDQLHQLGYAQELRRGMKTFSNFAVSFTIISILSGCLTLFLFAMNTGGPAIMTLGWLVVGFFVILVALGMAEVASSYPTAGGLYYWAAKLAPGVRARPGEVELVRRLVQPRRPGRRHRRHRLRPGGVRDRPAQPHGRLPGEPAEHDRGLRRRARPARAAEHLRDPAGGPAQRRVGVVARRRRRGHRHRAACSSTSTPGPISARCSRQTVNNTGFSSDMGLGLVILGIPLYVALIGLLNAQYTLTGYDASAHMSEETHGADIAAPRGIVFSVVISVIFGFILLVAMNVGITPEKIFPAAGRHARRRVHPRADIAHGRPAGPDLDRRRRPVGRHLRPVPRGRRPVLLRHVVGHGELADDLRVLARRRGPRQLVLAPDQQADPHADQLDLAGGGRRVHPRPAVPVQPGRLRGDHVDRGHRPVRRLHLAGVPAPARRATSSRKGRGRSAAGAGRSASSPRSGWRSCSSCSCSRRRSRSRSRTFNYTPVVFLVVLGGAAIWYFVSAKNWFKGPKVQGTPEELAAIERDLELQA